MLADILLLSVGIYGAGGLAAALYVGVYAITAVYVGLVLSSTACLVATGVSTASYLAVAVLQDAGWLPMPAVSVPNSWAVAAFNLLVLNIVGGLTAILAEAYRRSRRRLARLYQDLEHAYDQLIRLNTEIRHTARLQVLGGVVAGITHEIRNALQVASSHIELMRRKAGDLPPEVDRHLARVEHGFNAAMRIVKDALEMARHPSAETAPVSIPEVARRIADLVGYNLRRDGVNIRLDFPPDFPPVLGTPFQLEQVLLNLVTNAHEALRSAPGRRAITVAGISEPGRVVVEVRDTGPGILPTALPHLFEPFYTTKAHGTGLGLAISAGIVRDLGGELTADNRPEGGAVFRASLPTITRARTERA